MDKIILKDLFNRFWKPLLIVTLLILLFQKCTETNGLIATSKLHKQQANDYLLRARLSVKNSKSITAKYNKQIDSIVKAQLIHEKQLSKNTKAVNVKLAEIRHYSTSDNTKYLQERYSSANDDTIHKKAIPDLIIGDGAKAEVKILREVVKVEKSKFSLANAEIDSLHLGIEAISKNYESANTENKKALTDVEKAFKKERLKKNFFKLTTVIAIFGSGYLLIK